MAKEERAVLRHDDARADTVAHARRIRKVIALAKCATCGRPAAALRGSGYYCDRHRPVAEATR